MLLERGRAAEAVAQFEAALRNTPNRFNAVAGAAASAQRAADITKAKDYSEKLLALVGDGESTRPAVAAARQLLATR